jgi:hypothetical protein
MLKKWKLSISEYISCGAAFISKIEPLSFILILILIFLTEATTLITSKSKRMKLANRPAQKSAEVIIIVWLLNEIAMSMSICVEDVQLAKKCWPP